MSSARIRKKTLYDAIISFKATRVHTITLPISTEMHAFKDIYLTERLPKRQGGGVWGSEIRGGRIKQERGFAQTDNDNVL